MADLLEREGVLAALGGTVAGAARGQGAVAVVTGEHGIGKTSLVRRFASELDSGVRLLWGTCDDLSTPRPLGPFRDVAASVSPELEAQLLAGGPPHRFVNLLLDELAAGPGPTVLVIEDVHWADEATLDAVTVLGRRVGEIPAVLVLTVRSGETAPDHPLQAALGAVQHNTALAVALPPLSRAAVAELGGAERADRLYEVTGGNPFFVTEMVAEPSGELPLSVANAVLARCAHLDPAARDITELVSMVPGRIPVDVLDAVRPGWAAAAEEPERRQLLTVDGGQVRFRHELIRAAIRSSVPRTRQRVLHAELVDALLALGADPADVVHHAEAAGRTDTVLSHALLAARQAAALESNREAWQHYRRAAECADRLEPAERAGLFESYAQTAYHVGHMAEAFSAVERAIALYRAHGDEAAVGRCLGARSHLCWVAGEGRAALEQARAAVRILEPGGPTADLAAAYNQLTDLAALAGQTDAALCWGDRALRVAEQTGDDAARWRVRVAVAVALVQRDADDARALLEAIEGARHAEVSVAVVNGLIGLTFAHHQWVRPQEAERYARQGIDYAQAHQLDALTDYLRAQLAWLRLRAGHWDEAERRVRTLLERRPTHGMVTEQQANLVLTELAVRRGADDAPARLAELAARADRTGELLRLGPVLELEAEAALTGDGAFPAELFERVLKTVGGQPATAGCGGARLAAWGTLIGVPAEFSGKAPRPHAAMMRQDWHAAADAFGAVGWRYDQALMLSLCDTEDALREAMEIARGFPAPPLVKRVGRRLRGLGRSVPRGPAGTTRANPAGLTDRQLEILRLVAEGLTNAEIARRLSISPRTAEHHVSGVLAKLGVTTRRAATRAAADLGVTRP